MRLIDTDEAYKVLTKYYHHRTEEQSEALKEALGRVPTAEPIIRCGECKHNYVDGDNVRFNVCELMHNKVQSDDWYCADAERREDD